MFLVEHCYLGGVQLFLRRSVGGKVLGYLRHLGLLREQEINRYSGYLVHH